MLPSLTEGHSATVSDTSLLLKLLTLAEREIVLSAVVGLLRLAVGGSVLLVLSWASSFSFSFCDGVSGCAPNAVRTESRVSSLRRREKVWSIPCSLP